MIYLLIITFLIIINLYYIKEQFGRSVKDTQINNKFIYKKFNNKLIYMRIKKYYYDILHKWNFVPRMYFDDKRLIIKEDYYKTTLDKSNKPYDYKKQLRNIHNTIRNAGLFHNDYRVGKHGHLYIKNNKIYLIDYDGLSKHNGLPRNDMEKIIQKLND